MHENVERTSLNILNLERSLRDVQSKRELLTEAGYDVSMDCVEAKSDYTSLLRSHKYDVILSDFTLLGFDAFGAIQISRNISPGVPFICVSESIGEETAIELMKQGATDYVRRDNLVRLPSAIKRALDEARENKLRLQEEETLRASEERYRALVTFSPDALYVHVDSRVALVNPALCKLLGADHPAQLIGKSVFEIIHPEYHENVRARLNLVFGGLPAMPFEQKLIRLDGTAVDVEVKAVTIDWQGSKGVQAIVHDITERKRAEEVVRDSEERFRMVFEHVFDGISIYHEDPDPSKRSLVECNDRYAAMAGRSRDELLELGSTQGLQTTLEDTANSNRLESLSMGTAYRGSFSWIRPDGMENVIEYMGVPITWRGKSYSIGIDRDITERKKAEKQLVSSLREKEIMLKEIHHRVKNNMQVISSLLNLQAQHLPEGQEREVFQESMRRVRSMAMVHEHLYRSENMANIDFGEYLRSVTSDLLVNYIGRSVSCLVEADPVRLGVDVAIPCGLMVNELVTNSLKHAFQGRGSGSIVVSLHRRDDANIELAVQDDGIGFPGEIDFRGLSSMGMTLVVTLAEQISGTIAIERNRGTKFTIVFPA